MKKDAHFISYLFLVVFALFSCKKSDNSVNPNAETPIQTATKNLAIVDTFRNFPSYGGSFEIGTQLLFSKAGKISKLGCRPGTAGKFVVSLWENDTEALLAQTTITVTDINNYAYQSISPVNITIGKRYVVSINTNNQGTATSYWIYYRKAATPGNVVMNIYPFTLGSITFEGGKGKSSDVSIFPSTTQSPWNFFVGADVYFEPQQ